MCLMDYNYGIDGSFLPHRFIFCTSVGAGVLQSGIPVYFSKMMKTGNITPTQLTPNPLRNLFYRYVVILH